MAEIYEYAPIVSKAGLHLSPGQGRTPRRTSATGGFLVSAPELGLVGEIIFCTLHRKVRVELKASSH